MKKSYIGQRNKQGVNKLVIKLSVKKTNDQMRKKINNDHRDNLIGLSIPRFMEGHGSKRVYDTEGHNQYVLKGYRRYREESNTLYVKICEEFV